MELHMATVIEHIADVLDEQPAVIQGSTSRTWRQFDERASRLAAVLADTGLEPGARVGLYLTNSPEYLETWLAALKIRCIPVNINYRYVEEELEYLLDDSGCQAIVFPTQLSDRVASVLEGRDIRCSLQVAARSDGLIEGAERYEDVISMAEPLARMERQEDDQYIVYTGGTTGLPKGVVYEVGGLIRELANIVGSFIGTGEVSVAGDVVENARRANDTGSALTGLILPPLMHRTGMGFAMAALVSGGTVVLAEGGSFDPPTALDALEATGANLVVIVGDAFMRPLLAELERRSLAGSPADLSTVQLVMSAGAMLSSESKMQFLSHAPSALLIDQLAASEGVMGSSITSAGGGPTTAEFSLRPGTRVLDLRDIDIEPGSGETGRVAVPTDNPIGYYNDPIKTAETFRVLDGRKFSFPGDHASVEVDGTIRLLGRGNHCINTGGEKVYPEEVEEVLKSHPTVMDALVFGVEDEEWGQRVEAVVSSRDGSEISTDELSSHVHEHLAGYKAPKRVVSVETVPRATNGKPDYPGARALVAESPEVAHADSAKARREALRVERAPVAKYRGRFEWRIVVTFLFFLTAWTTVVVLGSTGVIPLWLGMVANTILASTFYMPMHEAVHGNIWGDTRRARWGEDLIGITSSLPLVLTSYVSHRTGHMRHHAFTNDPLRDPDHFSDGSLRELIGKLIAFTAFGMFLPVFAFVPPTRRLLPSQMRMALSRVDDNLKRAGIQQFRFWFVIHGILLLALLVGLGWEALLLWYVPARLAAMWLAFIFAWFPHHPADKIGRYVDTRVAVFPGVQWLARGHEYHALHHLFPRVPHYRLRALWEEVGEDMVAKGVRAEGSALYSTGPIVW